MNYPNVNMSIFLGPDVKNIRSLLTFLIEYSSKYDEKEKAEVKDDLSNVLAIRIQREFNRWREEPWVLPMFLDNSRGIYLTDYHNHREHFSSAKLVQLKGKHVIADANEYVRSKKIQETLDETLRVKLAEGENPEQKLRVDLMQQSFREAYNDRVKDTIGPLNNMWERKRITNERLAKRISDEYSTFSQKVVLTRKKRLREKKRLVQKVEEPEESEEVAEGKEEEIKEVVEEKKEREETPFEAFQKKLDKLKAEKEAEINRIQEELNQLDGKKSVVIQVDRSLKVKFEDLQKQRADILMRNKALQDLVMRKHEIATALDDAAKLENLVKEEEKIQTQVVEMQKEWGEIKQQMQEEIEKKKKKVNERKIEYTYKADQIKQMKKEINDSLREMKYKEELIKFLQEEYEKTPKDITRQFYVDRITETIHNVKSEKSQIDSTITDIKDLKEVISRTLESIREAENEVEEIVFKVLSYETLGCSKG
jgi:myosin heavy subunit